MKRGYHAVLGLCGTAFFPQRSQSSPGPLWTTRSIWTNHGQERELRRRLELHKTKKMEQGTRNTIGKYDCSQLPEKNPSLI